MFRKTLTALVALATLSGAPQSAMAQDNGNTYLGALWLFGGNFCPRGTAEAAGQLLPIASNTALFSLYGTMYGGDGRTNFGLPDLRGRVPLGQGQQPGLESFRQGAKGSAPTVTLGIANLPAHTHNVTVGVNGAAAQGSSPTPANNLNAIDTQGTNYGTGNAVPMAANSTTVTQDSVGGNQPIGIRDPYQVLRWCVNTIGTYPSRS